MLFTSGKLALWTLAMFILPVIHAAKERTNMSRLFTDLMEDYVRVPPIHDWREPVMVSLNFELYQIKSLDGKNQILSTFGQLFVFWQDDTFSWDPDDYGGIPRIELPATDLWRPTIGLRNSASSVYDSDWPELVPVLAESNGLLYWGPGGSFETSCSLNMLDFPFDIQICSLDWGNLVQPLEVMNLTLFGEEIYLNFYTQSKEFTLARTWVERVELEVHLRDGESLILPCIKFWMVLHRKPEYYLLNLIIPTIVLAILSAFTFMVPVDAGEKLSLSITVLLSFSVFMLLLSEITPQTSENTPILAIYLTTAIFLSGLSMVCTILSLNMYHRNPVTPLPKLVRMFTIGCLGRVIMPYQIHKVESCSKLHPGHDDVPGWGGGEVNGVSFVKIMEDTSNENLRPKSASMTAVELLLVEIRRMTAKLEERDAEDVLKAEWMLAAQISDRFFFLVFIIAQTALTVFVVVGLPHADLVYPHSE